MKYIWNKYTDETNLQFLYNPYKNFLHSKSLERIPRVERDFNAFWFILYKKILIHLRKSHTRHTSKFS